MILKTIYSNFQTIKDIFIHIYGEIKQEKYLKDIDKLNKKLNKSLKHTEHVKFIYEQDYEWIEKYYRDIANLKEFEIRFKINNLKIYLNNILEKLHISFRFKTYKKSNINIEEHELMGL